MALKILGKAASINVRKVLWTCAELGLAFEREDWGSGFRSTQDPAFLALNPNGLVPVLVDGDAVLRESNTICRYLAARAGRIDLLPPEPAARARVEQWMDWQATELNNAWRYAFMALVRNSPQHTDPAAITASVAGWHRHVAMLEQQLARGGPFVCGATFTLADVVLGLSINRWRSTPLPDRTAMPEVTAWFEIAATRQTRGRWSLGAGFSETWNGDQASSYSGQTVRNNVYPATPNDLINTNDGRYDFTMWTAKINGSYDAGWGIRVTPALRFQQGQPYGRTFLAGAANGINYGTQRILAEPIDSRRQDDISILDVRMEKGFTMANNRRLGVLLDVYNLTNSKAAQNINWGSGGSFERPISIVGPTIVRFGLKFDW
mgnify:CR=1 FL=1